MIEGPRTDEAGPAVDPTGAPVEDAGLGADVMEGTRPASGRVLDRGAIYAAMVGLGLAVTIAISFALVIAIQALVFVSAPLAGLVIGFYANHKSERWRPRWRLFANAGFAGLVTGLSLGLMYVGIRLLFIYADSGYRPEPMGGQLDCAHGAGLLLRAAHRRGGGGGPGVARASPTQPRSSRPSGRARVSGCSSSRGSTVAGALLAAGWRAVRRPPAGAVAGSAGAAAAG